MEKPRGILLLGPPGSGKGTQGRLLAREEKFYHLSVGEVLRRLSPTSEAGLLYQQYAARGNLLPDACAVEIWQHHLRQAIALGHFQPQKQLLLLDGLPRTPGQAKMLDQALDVLAVILLEIADESVLYDRIALRARSEQRADDQQCTILQRRLAIYNQTTLPLIAHYTEREIRRIDATAPATTVLQAIRAAIATILPPSVSLG